MERLYLLRHGETEWNIKKITQGTTDIQLTDKGKEQAKKAAYRLIHEKIDYIYASHLSRAFETAKIIGEILKINIETEQSLREMNFGQWQGLSVEDLQTKYPKEHIIWRSQPHKWSLKGAETLLQVQERTLSTINDLRKKHPNKNVLMVSHGATIKALLLGILNLDLSNYHKLTSSNTGISIIEYKEEYPVILLLNDTCHLREV